ncbi:TetR family transcriptional regulator [Microvirga terricola]|uniref:TetR family transcriptional regulator n=1 Tax=Microvirga terricola TaxID=2719797 RepID=A0ABX0V835_9HYPH|nr:TetR family transcriptional regulator [Microvirga terricola]
MRRTKQQAEETRQTVLSAAETLFLDRGYEHVSLDEIAAASGVTRGAVHWHFQNKQGLLFAIRDKLRLPVQELSDQLEGNGEMAPVDALANAISDTFARLQADPRHRGLLKVLLRLDVTDETNSGDIFQKEFRASLRHIFDIASRSGKLVPPWTPESATVAFNAVVGGLLVQWARGLPDFELIPDAEAIIRTLLTAWQTPTDAISAKAAR